ncbi:MAG: nucleotidyltransferase family protein [Acidobacteriota bacterium]
MIAGIILAAGRSSRMGRAKALLRSPGGLTFVHRLARAMCDGGLADTIVVGRPEDAGLRQEVAAIGTPVRFIENPGADAGQLSSVLAGLDAAQNDHLQAVVLAPVDAPLIRPETFAAVAAVFASSGAPIVRAVHGGRHGHPVLFSHAIFEALRRADPAIGARSLVRGQAHLVVNVEVDDPGVLTDVDTPEDYARLIGPVA